MSRSISQWPDAAMDQAQVGKFLRDVYKRVKFGSFTWNPGTITATSVVDTTLTSTSYEELDGLRSGQAIAVTPPSTFPAGLGVGGAWVPADNQLNVRLVNHTGSPIVAGSGNWSFHGVMF